MLIFNMYPVDVYSSSKATGMKQTILKIISHFGFACNYFWYTSKVSSNIRKRTEIASDYQGSIRKTPQIQQGILNTGITIPG